MTTRPENNPYRSDDILQTLRDAGVRDDDLLLTHIAMDGLGIPEDIFQWKDPWQMLEHVFDEAVGPAGTLLTPAFSYSFCGNGEIFDARSTRSKVGGFSNYLIRRGNWRRSRDPLFSMLGRGPLIEELFHELPETSFGVDSLFDRLLQRNCKVCLLGIELTVLTAMHHFEFLAQVPYRYDKPFTGIARTESGEESQTWRYYVRARDPRTEHDFTGVENEALSRGVINRVPLGGGTVSVFHLREINEMTQRQLKADAFCLIREPIPEAELKRLIVEDLPKAV